MHCCQIIIIPLQQGDPQLSVFSLCGAGPPCLLLLLAARSYIKYGRAGGVGGGGIIRRDNLLGSTSQRAGATAWSLQRKIFFLQNSLPTWQPSVNT